MLAHLGDCWLSPSKVLQIMACCIKILVLLCVRSRTYCLRLLVDGPTLSTNFVFIVFSNSSHLYFDVVGQQSGLSKNWLLCCTHSSKFRMVSKLQIQIVKILLVWVHWVHGRCHIPPKAHWVSEGRPRLNFVLWLCWHSLSVTFLSTRCTCQSSLACSL